jgi:precorrin-3B synthase
MESGDGFIVRVHPGFRARSSAEVRTLAALARDFGNGQIEVTRRANWQLRGVTSGGLPALQTALATRGLAEPAAAAEAAASLLVDPLSGLDPACAPLEPVAAELERELASENAPRDLPAKFGIVLDGGSGVLAGVNADIRIALSSKAPSIAHLSVDGGNDGVLLLGACRTDDVAAAVLALLTVASRSEGTPRRMRDVLAAQGSELLRRAVARFLVEGGVLPAAPRTVSSFIGFRRGIRNWVGLGLPFGSGDFRQWTAIAEIADQFGDGALRLTPRRTVIIAGMEEGDGEAVLAAARRCELVVDDGDARLRVTACVGAPSCGAARGETRRFASDMASAVAPLLWAGGTLHVSGCAKSCAHSGPATLTVVCDEGGYRIARDRDVAGAGDADLLPQEAARRLLTAMALDPALLERRS